MATFNQSNYGGSYSNAMDRGYETISEDAPLNNEVTDIGLTPKDIGISAPPMQDALQGLKAKIFQGASKVELGFMGRGKGSLQQGGTTPEMYGMDERSDMRELAEFNKVKLSTHATTAVGNLSGLGEGGFNEQAREQAFNEIRRAVDFAADVTPGGAIVVHTGEYPRAVSEEFAPDFMAYPLEPKKAQLHVVDKRTGEVFPIKKDKPIVVPVWETNEQGEYVLDEKGRKIPQLDPKTGSFMAKERYWDYIVKEADRWNGENPDKKRTYAEQYYQEQLELEELQSTGWACYLSQGYEESLTQRDKIKKAIDYYQQIEDATSEEEKSQLKMQMSTDGVGGLVPPDTMMPTELLKNRLKSIEHHIEHNRYGAVSYNQQAERIREIKNNIVPIKDYAISKTADTVARSAIFAMKKTEQMHKKDPLYIAPENLFPEQYGSHPQELKHVILQSRKAMTDELVGGMGYDREEAKKLAAQHIKATFDIGHAYTWRKYFIGDAEKSVEANDKMFNKWLINQVKDLNESGIIGHVHVSDNFGFEDEHIDPGQGKAPIREFINQMKEAGIKDVIVEPAHQDYRAMLGGWKTFGSSVYGLSSPAGDTWADVWRSYFGQTTPPYFLYGESAPDAEHWVLWSGTRME
ncbi:MAG: sugar phosphate isomerase/epimerase [bacterium]|nr:sugar phosphate isomerase/epimerase [bacterium]